VGEIGFMTERNGTITVDGARLSSALTSNYGGVRTLFITQTGITGVAQRLTDAVNSLSDVRFGSVALRRSSLTREITRLGDDIARREAALALHEERLRRQYAALDGLLRQLQTQSGFLLANSSARNPNRLQ
jgi:flagellar hook-associated protein 2